MQDDGSWVDVSVSGLCSYSLSTINLTNSVILEYESQYGYAVKAYFAEQGTNRLHEIDLGEQESNYYNVPNYGEHELKITRLVSAVAFDGSFTGLRLESSTGNSDDVYHKWFSSIAQTFCSKIIPSTETIAFNSQNLKYLVTFSANHKAMIVISEDGTTRQYKLDSSLRDPIQYQNIIGPVDHYLVCLAKESGPILINVKAGTSRTIMTGSNVTNIGRLTDDTVYLLTNGQEMIIVPISTPHRLVNLTIHNDDIRVINSIEYDHNRSIQKDDHNVPVLLIVLSLLVSAIVVLVSLSLCVYGVYKKRKWITDRLSQYRRLQDVTTVPIQCRDNSVDIPESRLRSPPDGKPS